MADFDLFAQTLPDDPLPVLERWLADAVEAMRAHNPTAMTLATLDERGYASARMVICRGFDASDGWVVFYTDRTSTKGSELAKTPRAALVFYWEPLNRSVRIEGPITEAPDAQSDAYFASRPVGSQLAAWASDQSAPLDSREALLARYRETQQRFAISDDRGGPAEVPRPPRWGGYRVWIECIEFWAGRPDRLHDRARYDRRLDPQGDGFAGKDWRVQRLQP